MRITHKILGMLMNIINLSIGKTNLSEVLMSHTHMNSQEPLYEMRCEACSIGTLPLTEDEIIEMIADLSPEWIHVNLIKLERTYKFKNFREALDFVNLLGDIADAEGHHPDIQLGWGRVVVSLTTHKIHGLSLYDFIMASKFDQILQL